MHVEIERAAESLDQRHSPGHRARAGQARLADQMARDRPIDDAEQLRDQLTDEGTIVGIVSSEQGGLPVTLRTLP